MTYVNTVERVALRRGKQEGKVEGRLEGAAELLAALIVRKFGEVPEWAQTCMAQADEATLNRWAMRILDATRIEDVFA